MFLEECKYVVKEIKIRNYITNDAQISSDKNDLLEIFSDYKEHSDEEFMEKYSDKESSI